MKHRRHAPLLCSPLTLAATLLAVGLAPAHAADRTVAILYFDNNTGDSQYDVFQKGLADMLIADLAEVPGITVVERDRLQALLDEIALQKTTYFDKKTAVKLGKGLGARYAVIGTISEFKPTLRLDVRMVEVATGTITVTAKVSAKHADIFDLEQQLVARLVARLNQKFTASTHPRTRVPDVDALLAYSRAVDLADQGLYRDASQHMAQVVSSAPSFALARLKRSDYIKRLQAAGALRKNIQAALTSELARKVEASLVTGDMNKLGQDDAKRHLAYRSIRGRYILAALPSMLSSNKHGPRVVRADKQKQARALMEAYVNNCTLHLREYDIYARRFTKIMRDGLPLLDTFIRLPRADELLARDAGLGRIKFHSSYVSIVDDLARLVLLGKFKDVQGNYVQIVRPLGERDFQYKKLAYLHLRRGWARSHNQIKTVVTARAEAIRMLRLHATALFFRDQNDAGIAKLQEVLDRYPTARNYGQVEREIKRKLGLVHDANEKKRERYRKGLAQCGDMDLRVGVPSAMSRKFLMSGYAGVDAIVAEVERACQSSKLSKRYWPSLYRSAALIGGKRGNCAMFESYMKRYLAAGGSARDLVGYRKNYTPCPTP